MLALNARELRKTYVTETGLRRNALDGISLQVPRGGFVTIVGGNGSGKSSLLKVIAGIVNADTGSVELFGEDVSRQPAYVRSRFVTYVDQDPSRSCPADLTVAETLCLGRPVGWLRSFEPLLTRGGLAAATTVLAAHAPSLTSMLRALVSGLSGGERQLLALLVALVRGCPVLLLDEHTAALDASNADRVWDLTQALHAHEGKTIVVVTHDLSRALQLPGRLIVMSKGRSVFDGDAEHRGDLSRNDLMRVYSGFAVDLPGATRMPSDARQ